MASQDHATRLPVAAAAGGTQQPLRLNVGCGPVQPEGWINIDGSLRARLAHYAGWIDQALVRAGLLSPTEFNRNTCVQDIRRGLRFAGDTVSAVYAGEMLEHLTRAEGARFLAECYRVLRPGGVLRIRVPDNYEFWQKYIAEYDLIYARPQPEWNDAHTRWIDMFFGDICIQRPWFRSMGHFHKWMYDEVSLVIAFRQAGFADVARRQLHESAIPDIEQVETRSFLTVEGVKPDPSSSVDDVPASGE